MKDSFAKQPGLRAKLADGRFALREMAPGLRDRRIWMIISGVVLLVALAGPFYTLDSLDLAGRIAYWGMIGIPGALMMWAINLLVGTLCPPRWPGAVVGAMAGALGILPLMILVAVGMALVGLDMPNEGFVGLFRYVAPTVIGISVLVQVLLPAARKLPAAASSGASTGLFARLPPELGRDIIAVQAQDHYIRVSTSRGSHLILMRMSDAAEDLAGLGGMQIHRSWWVNLEHASGLEKPENGGTRLVLRNNIRVPVPRSRVSGVKHALATMNRGQ